MDRSAIVVGLAAALLGAACGEAGIADPRPWAQEASPLREQALVGGSADGQVDFQLLGSNLRVTGSGRLGDSSLSFTVEDLATGETTVFGPC